MDDVYGKFASLGDLEVKGWKQEKVEVVEEESTRRRAGGQRRQQGGQGKCQGSASSGLKALIARRRREAGEGKAGVAVEVTEVEQVVGAGGDVARVFDGGFFTLVSPAAPRCRPAVSLATRSAGRQRLVASAVTDSSRRTACLLSPFISQFAKLGLSAR